MDLQFSMMTDLELAHHYALALLCKQAREMEHVRDELENLIRDWQDGDDNVATLRKIANSLPDFRKVSKP